MQKVALVLWRAQVLVSIGMVIAGAVNIHTLMVTGPLLALSGLGVAVSTRQLQSWTTFLFGLSAPLLCVLVAFLIAAYRLEPDEAQIPMMVVIILGMLAMMPLARRSLRRIRDWPTNLMPRPLRWRFSLWSLFVFVTGACLVLAMERLLSNILPSWHARFLFVWFIVVNLAGCSGALWLFLSSESARDSSDAMPTGTDSLAGC